VILNGKDGACPVWQGETREMMSRSRRTINERCDILIMYLSAARHGAQNSKQMHSGRWKCPISGNRGYAVPADRHHLSQWALKVPYTKGVCLYRQMDLCLWLRWALSAPHRERVAHNPQVLRTRGYPKVGHFQRPGHKRFLSFPVSCSFFPASLPPDTRHAASLQNSHSLPTI